MFFFVCDYNVSSYRILYNLLKDKIRYPLKFREMYLFILIKIEFKVCGKSDMRFRMKKPLFASLKIMK